jgi:hypothetical protein
MQRNEKTILFILISIILINIAQAVDFVPSGNINGKGIYGIKNFTSINATEFYANGVLLTSGGSGGNDSWNETYADTKYVPYTGANNNLELGTYSFKAWLIQMSDLLTASMTMYRNPMRGTPALEWTQNSMTWTIEQNKSGIDELHITGPAGKIIASDNNITAPNICYSNGTNCLSQAYNDTALNNSIIPTAQSNMYWNNISGKPTHLTNFTNDLNIGNWSDDQSDYYTLSQVNAIISSINNLTNNSIIIFVNDSIGNWSQDKNGYYNKTEIDSIVFSNSNLTLAQVVANIGNWSADKNDYYNKSTTDTLISGNRTTHETNFKHGNTTEEIQDVIGPWMNGTYDHATITYNDTTNDFNLTIHDDWWNDDTDIPYHEIIPQRIVWQDVPCPTGYHYNNLLGEDLTCEQEQEGDPDLWIYLSGFNFIFNTSKLLEFLPTYYFTKTDINNATIIRNHNTSWVATSLSNTTIVRNGTKTCAGTTLLQNVTANSSGIFGDCVAPASAPAETDPYWTGNSSTVARTGTATCAVGTVAQNVTTTTTGTTSQCVAIPSLSETDPLWTGNQSSYLTTVNAVSYFVNRSLWTSIDNYPAGCSAGQYVSTIGDTLTCGTPAGTGLDLATAAIHFVNRSLWTTIDNYPSACGAGSYVTAIGDTLTCDTPPGTTYTSDEVYINKIGSTFTFNTTKNNATIDARSINNVVEDTTPELGGNLNASGYNISVGVGDKYCLNYACTSYVRNNGTHTLII